MKYDLKFSLPEYNMVILLNRKIVIALMTTDVNFTIKNIL